MTTVTGFLRDPNQAPTIAAHNAETIENVRQDMLDHFARMVAEQITEIRALREMVRVEIKAQDSLQAEVKALREVAVASQRFRRLYILDDSRLEDALDDLIAAGYLPAEETRP